MNFRNALYLSPDNVRAEYQKLIQQQTARKLREVLTNAGDCDADLVELLSKDDRFAFLYAQSAQVREGYSLGFHTRAVLKQNEKYFSLAPLPDGMSPFSFQMLLALHDIGKPLPDSRAEQHHYTLQVIHEIEGELPLQKNEIRLMKSLINGDPLGTYLKEVLIDAPHEYKVELGRKMLREGITRDDLNKFQTLLSLRYPVEEVKKRAERTAVEIRNASSSLGVPLEDYFGILSRYYQCDCSAYTTDAGGLPALEILFELSNEEGRLFRYDEDRGRIRYSPPAEEAFVLLERQVLR